MKIQKVDKSSFDGTKNDSSTNADVTSVSQPIAKPNVIGGLSPGVIDFILHLHLYDEWHHSDGLWRKGGYKSRTTQELFEYHLVCKERGLNGC